MISYIAFSIRRNKIFLIFSVFIVFQLLLILFFKRGIFLDRYDAIYWKDRYEHSQLVLPLSQRVIGDDGLYAYAGYRQIRRDDPFEVNVDKPPLAKYFIGASILFFGNPVIMSQIFVLLVLNVFFLLAKHCLQNKLWAICITAILFVDPSFFSQGQIVNLDIFQLFFFLLSWLLIFKSKNRPNKTVLLILAGLSVGLFAETKPPILLPFVASIQFCYLFLTVKKRSLALYFVGIIAGIFIPYIWYMHLGHSVLDVAKIHKYMISIYQQSKLTVHNFAIWQTLFSGRFPHITTGKLITIDEWWIVLPAVTVFGLIASVKTILNKEACRKEWIGISAFTYGALILYSVIPSYPRYLLIILPFLYLLAAKGLMLWIRNNKMVYPFMIGLCIFGILHAYFFLKPSYENLLANFSYNYSHLYLHDIYQENASYALRQIINRDSFRKIVTDAYNEAGIRSVDVVIEEKPQADLFTNSLTIPIKMIYKTQDLGNFIEEKELTIIKEHMQWKVQWDWDLVVNEFKPGLHIDRRIIAGPRGKIIGKNGVIAEDKDTYLISINPAAIDRKKEEELLRFVASFADQSWLNLQNGYLENVLPNTSVPLVSSFRPIDERFKSRLLSYPGVMLTEYLGRVYYDDSLSKDIGNVTFNECCTRIYSSTNYRGIGGLEKRYNETLSGSNGGVILLVDNNDRPIKTIVAKEAKKGSDVFIN